MKALYLKTYNQNNNIYFEIETDTVLLYTPTIEIILTDGENNYPFTIQSTKTGNIIKFNVSIKQIKDTVKENFIIKSPIKLNILTDETSLPIEIETDDTFNNTFNNTLTGEIKNTIFNLWKWSALTSINRYGNILSAFPDFYNTIYYEIDVLELPGVLNPKLIKTEDLNNVIETLDKKKSGTVYLVEDAADNIKVAIPIITDNSKSWKRLNIEKIYKNFVLIYYDTYGGPLYSSSYLFQTSIKMSLNAIQLNYNIVDLQIETKHFNNEISNLIPPTDDSYYIRDFIINDLTKPYIYNDITTEYKGG